VTEILVFFRDFKKAPRKPGNILSLPDSQTVTEGADWVTNKTSIYITTLLQRGKTHLLLRHKPSILMQK
jgi:hypothetical protein